MTSSHSWSDGPVPDDLQMIYDIIVDKDNWLVSGTKRGTFQVKVSFLQLSSVSYFKLTAILYMRVLVDARVSQS